MSLRRQLLGCMAAIGALAPHASAQATPRPQPFCIRGVSLDRAGEVKATLILRAGAIAAVLDEAAPVPPGVRVIDGAGLLCLPAFLDSYSRQGCTVPQPVKDQDVPPDVLADVGIDMRLANRKGIQPAFLAATALAISKEQGEAWRKHGFGALLVAPGGELLSGTSTLSTTREAAMRDLVLRDEVFAHAAFAASGPGYPSTLMGYFAQLRQFLLDCQRQIELEQRYGQGRPGLRPPFDAELASGAALVSGQRSILCEASESDDIERWLRLADEFGLFLDFVGGLEAWRVKEILLERDATVVLTLDWGKEAKDPRPKDKKGKEETEKERAESEPAPEVEPMPDPGVEHEVTTPADEEQLWKYEEPFAVRLERRQKWEQGRDCALRLHEAGVRFVFGTANGKPGELLKNVRSLVEAGLPADVALDALTRRAAEFLGVEERLGSIATGHDATFTLWRADPLTDEDASPAWIFVDGFPSEFKEQAKKSKENGVGPGEGVDPTGTWRLVFAEAEGVKEATLALEMEEDGSVTGTLEFENPTGGPRVESEVEGHVAGDQLELECTLEFGEFEIDNTLTATIEGDTLDGESSYQPPGSNTTTRQTFSAKREPE
ncbi:MAG: amidohydrolase family protein [Planctomycetes bacterium]|nr:amidohydrolase family protein [Planctomycetota bacterium]